MAGRPASSNSAYSSLARGDGRETETDRLFVCKCGNCAHNGEKRVRDREEERIWGLCGWTSFERLCCAGTRWNYLYACNYSRIFFCFFL